MSEQEFIGWLVIGGGAIIGLFFTVTKPVLSLKEQLVTLNLKYSHMVEKDTIRDKRIEKHGIEIDKLDDRLHEAEHELSNHETRIQSLERKK